MASLSMMKLCHLSFFYFMLICMIVVSVSSFQFEVGGERGWIKPTGNETETYNEWATQNRFHVGDTLYFGYKKDSVLLVNSTSYNNCTVSNPISKFENGSTKFRFDRYGIFYFISGQPDNCKAGQKLIVRVMVHPMFISPQPAPSPQTKGSGDGDDWDPFNWGPPSMSSTLKMSVASCLIISLGGMLVLFSSY
ncbi:Cu_bind_like domain-containing protein [Cephalotus follicularis]|uniref:Cu_bind_like domain-containing protein n=1 Tax=Cephalotus follicularis TaxID=3775 RepID=A0A1Q3BLH4_CEPFO|nr:Cu_bind_like domain-containing protein [Cephalotus follicularis]